MKRRDFLKCAAGVSTMAMYSYTDSVGADQKPQVSPGEKPRQSDRPLARRRDHPALVERTAETPEEDVGIGRVRSLPAPRREGGYGG